jgi:hypothetical protein
VNIIRCTAGEDRAAELTLFGLMGSSLILERSSIFHNAIRYLATSGSLTFLNVLTDLPESVPVVKCEFSFKKSDFNARIKTVKMVPFKTGVCHGRNEPEASPPATLPSFLRVDSNSGILTFLGITGFSAIGMFVYYVFLKAPGGYERLDSGKMPL